MDGYVLEYSQAQKCYHIQTLRETIKLNVERLQKNAFVPDYVVIGYGTMKEMSKLCTAMKEQIRRPY